MISVCGNVKRPGVFEVPFGITIREIVYDLAGGMENEDYPLRLVQLGGASGRICSPAQLDTPYTYKGMRQADLTAIGSGAVLVVDERTSVIGFLRMTQEFFSHESCGQCTPCREGNRHISLLLDKVAEGTHTAQDIATLKKFADIMSSASLCGLGETAQSALLSCMKRFPEVFAVKRGGRRPMSEMVHITINKQPLEVPAGTRIIEAAKMLNIDIPHLCYHPDQTIKAHCRMCMVEVVGSRKLTAACSTVVWEGMEVITDSKKVYDAQTGVLDLILSDHKTNCLSCARNGSCELQALCRRFNRLHPELPDISSDEPLRIDNPSIVRDPAKCVKCGRCVKVCAEVQAAPP